MNLLFSNKLKQSLEEKTSVEPPGHLSTNGKTQSLQKSQIIPLVHAHYRNPTFSSHLCTSSCL